MSGFYMLIMPEDKCPQGPEKSPDERTRDDGKEIRMKVIDGSCAERKVFLGVAWN